MLQRTREAREKLVQLKADMHKKERALQEYAALREEELEKNNFMDVIATIMTLRRN